ncbi:MAG TPA: NUDIX hydrolase [Sphingomicrobium sp.]|nr:NUDIX hydrolase [Sphingomicrobium sp.]
MSKDTVAPRELMWSGKYIRVFRQGRWEYVSRTNDISAVGILAEHGGRVILVEQYRVPIGRRCLELPAGLVGDEDANATVEETAIKELEEETGFTADRVERLGEFHSSPGMVAESFTLVRAHGVRKMGDGGGTEHEEISVHLVARDEIPAFVEARRRAGVAVDTKLLMFLDC